MRGMPDWGKPIERDEGRLYRPFERDGMPLALPDTLAIAAEPDGRPAFRVAAFRGIGAPGRGRIDMELILLTSVDPEVARAVPALRGWLRLRSSMLDLPPDFETPVELDCSGLGLARLTLPLTSEGVTFVESVLADGALPVIAAVDLEIVGIAPRIAGRAAIDLGRLAPALADGTTTPGMLRDRLAADSDALGVRLEGIDEDSTRASTIAEIVTDHIRARLCAGPLLPAGDEGLALAPLDPSLQGGRAVLDLSQTVTATRTVALALDPFRAARHIASGRGGTDDLFRRVSGTALPSGHHRIAIETTIRPPLAGPFAIGANLVLPPHPPGRPFEIRRDFELPADNSVVEQQVRLAPSEPLAWSVSTFAIWPAPGGRSVERIESEAQRGTGTGTDILLRPADFPLTFIDVEADPALLALASVSIALEGTRGDDPARASVLLSRDVPRATLAVPKNTTALALSAVLTLGDNGSTIALDPVDASDWRIELFDVPGYGPRNVEISVALPPGVPAAAIDVLAEDAPEGEEPATYSFTAATAARRHRWFCRNPFRPGLRWRWRGDPAFSEPTGLAERLDLAFTEEASA